MSDQFGDRMKRYEKQEAGRQLIPTLPAMIRLDGKSFHTWTKGLERPYDHKMGTVMMHVTKKLVDMFNARMGYTQSDEITLMLYSDDYKKEIYFDGKIQKLCSVAASVATAHFNQLAAQQWGGQKALAYFDARVWNVPTKVEAANCFLWREQDATKNSISMAAHHYYSTNELHGKSGAEKQEMLFQKGVNWNDYPDHFKRGVWFQRKRKFIRFTAEELDQLPEQHAARKDPDLTMERNVVQAMTFPKFSSVTNRVEVIFDGADPDRESDEN